MKLNDRVRTVCETYDDENDKKFDILAIIELKNKPGLYRASIRVSNIIRQVISKSGDRLFVGALRSCKVYDNFYVKRCFNCQKFGHLSTDCTHSAVCGHCAGAHQTRDCVHKNDSTKVSCSNCKSKQGSKPVQCNHPAYSMGCPVYRGEQTKLKQSIPFYQKRQ